MEQGIIKIIEELRPNLEAHGGSIEFLGFDKEKMAVKVRLSGACRSCPMSLVTLKEGVLTALREKYPSIKEIINA